METDGGFLLDTCVIIYLNNGRKIPTAVELQIEKAAHEEQIHVSTISAWEIGSLVSLGRISLAVSPKDFFYEFLRRSQARLLDLTPEVLIDASFLPGRIHKDPMDRILIATARSNGLNLITSDKSILNYGRDGHVKTMAC